MGIAMAGKEYSEEQLEAHILYCLARRRRWGEKHMPLIYVRSGLPPAYRGDAEDIAKRLRNKGFLSWLPKTGGIHVSLRLDKRKEITEIIEKYFGKQMW